MIGEVDARISRALGKIRQAFRGVGSGVNSSAPVQLFQGEALAGEQLQDNELMQHYGFTSRSPPGFMFVCVPVGGKTAHGIAVATEHASYRLQGLESGEMAIYTDEGDSIILKRGHLIEVTTETLRITATTKVEIITPLVTTTGQVQADLDITDKVPAGGKSMASMRASYNTHTHHENDASGETNVPTQQV